MSRWPEAEKPLISESRFRPEACAILTDAPVLSLLVETPILAEYRDKNIRTLRLREAVESLREIYDLRYPLAHLQPYLAAEHGDLAVESKGLDADDAEGFTLLAANS